MSSKKKIAALAIAGVGVIGYSALWVVPAFATSGTTTTVNWLMPKGATATNPLWPQDLLQGSIPCERVIQKDVYTTDKKDDERLKMSADKRLASFIAEITADKKLTWSNGQSEDSALAAKYGVKIAWSFVQGEKCSTPTPTKPTETPTPTVTVTTPKPTETPTPTVTVTTPKPTETTSTPTTGTTVSYFNRVCKAFTVKTNVVQEIQIVASAKVNGVPLATPTYGSDGGYNTATFVVGSESAIDAEVTITAENADPVTENISVPAASGCSTSTPTTPVVNPPVVNPPKATTKATVEVISTQHPGIGG